MAIDRPEAVSPDFTFFSPGFLIPGSGLALWHIDETQSDNTDTNAYMVGLVQADGLRQLELAKNRGDAGDVFPGSAGVTSIEGRRYLIPWTSR